MWKFASFFTHEILPRLASIGLQEFSSIEGHEQAIRRYRYGEVASKSGALIRIAPRWWPRHGSEWEAYQESYLRHLPKDFCRTYYAFPRCSPGFMSVLYAHSGPATRYRTLYRAVKTIDSIARIKNAQAIVCQIMNERASERLLKRWGYVRHAIKLGGHHYIKRLSIGT